MSFRFACGAMASAILVTLAPAALAHALHDRYVGLQRIRTRIYDRVQRARLAVTGQ